MDGWMNSSTVYSTRFRVKSAHASVECSNMILGVMVEVGPIEDVKTSVCG